MAGYVERHQSTIDAQLRESGLRWAHRIGQRVTSEAKDRCPVDEGTLRASIDYVVSADSKSAKAVVGSPLDYAEYFHTGTGIYGPKGTPITPVSKKALKFKWEPTGGGPKTKSKDKRGVYFFASVKGMPANPFLIDALQAVMGKLQSRRRK